MKHTGSLYFKIAISKEHYLIPKFWVLMFVLFSAIKSQGQVSKDFLLVVEHSINMSCCGACDMWTFRDFRIATEDEKTELFCLDGAHFSTSCDWYKFTINKAAVFSQSAGKLKLVFWDGIDDHDQAIHERDASLAAVIDPLSDGQVITDGYYYSNQSNLLGTRWHSGTATAKASMYQIPEVSFNDPYVCYDQPTDKTITLNLNGNLSTLASQVSYKIELSTIAFPNSSTKIRTIDITNSLISKKASSLSLSWNELAGPYSELWLKKTIYVRVLATFSTYGGVCYNDYKLECLQLPSPCSSSTWYKPAPGNGYITDNSKTVVVKQQFPAPTVTFTDQTCYENKDGKISFSFPNTVIDSFVISVSAIIPKIPGTSCDDSKANPPSFSDNYGDYCLTGWTNNFTSNSTSITLGGLSAGTYSFKAEQAGDGPSCITTGGPYVIGKPNPLILSNITKSEYKWADTSYNIKQYGITDAVTITATGGTSPYTYSEGADSRAGGGSFVFSGLYAGDHTFSLTDANGCIPTYNVSRSINLRQPDPLTLNNIIPDTVWCNKLNTGTHNNGVLHFGISGGIGPYEIGVNSISNIVKTNQFKTIDLTELTADPYTIYVKDHYISSSSFATNIPEHLRLGITPVKEEDKHWPPCVYGNNGYINLSGYGGVPYMGKYRFKVYDANGVVKDTTNTETALHNLEAIYPIPPLSTPNTYTLKITDKLGCSDSITNVTIPQNPNPLTIVLLDTIRPTCNAYKNGTARFTAINGDPFHSPYYGFNYTLRNLADSLSYKKSLEGEIVQFEDIYKGSYQISIKDSNDCIINNYYRDTVFISDPNSINLENHYKVRNVSRKGLSNGGVQVFLQGGNGRFRYRFCKGLNDTIKGSTSDTIKIDGLYAGNYLIQVQDTCGCADGASSVASENAWLESTITVSEPKLDLSFAVKENKSVSCNGLADGRLIVEGDGGWGNNYRYGLDSVSLSYDGTFNKLTVGLYTVYVADTMGVLFRDTVRVTEPDLLVAWVDSISDARCYGSADGWFSLNVTGGTAPYYVSTDNNLNRLLGASMFELAAEDYTISLSDSNRCSISVNLSIGQPQPLTLSLDTLVNTLCGEASGKLVVSGHGGTPDFIYSWVSASGAIIGNKSEVDNLPAGLFRLSLTDSHQCQKQSSWYNIVNSDGPVISDTIIHAVSCYGYADGGIELTVDKGTAPYSYVWSNGQTTKDASKLISDMYWVSIADSNHCANYGVLFVPTPDSLTIEPLQINNPQCYGYSNGSITVSGKGGSLPYSYSWNNGATAASDTLLADGIYTLQLTDFHLCTANAQFNLVDPTPLVVDLGGEATICGGQIYKLDAGAYSAYSWTSDVGFVASEQIVQVTDKGTYYLEVTDSKGCTGRDTFALYTSNSLLNADFIIKSEASVGDTVVAIDISWPMPDSIYWEYDRNSISSYAESDYENLMFSKAGIYTVTLYASLGQCHDNFSHEITIASKAEEKSLKLGAEEPLIQSFKVLPNPNSGNFTVTVGLREVSDISLKFFSSAMVLDKKKVSGLSVYSMQYSLPNLTPGIYVLQLLAGTEHKELKMIVY